MPYIPMKLRVRNFIGDLWSGNFGLARTYWYYGVAIGVGFSFLTFVIRGLFGDFFALPFEILSIPYAVIASVGIWRAAGQYNGSKIISTLAKIAVVFGWLYPVIQAVVAEL